jgi:SAM-dependent methyltransferase
VGRIHAAAAVGFERSADRYERGRPSYPADAVSTLVDALEIGPERQLLDLGAGTGKLTRLLVPTGARIIAVEPVPAMRAALERTCPDVTVLDGSAEAIPVRDRSIDAVVVAQAFHWFDADAALREIARVLRDRGALGLIWNVRDETPSWSRRLTEMFDRLSGPDAPRYKHGQWRAAFDRTDAFGLLHHRSTRSVHEVPPEGFLDRVLSVSYVASAPDAERTAVEAEVRDLLAHDPDLAGRSTIGMPYVTDVFWCERSASATIT